MKYRHQELTIVIKTGEAGPRRIYKVPRPQPVGKSQGDLEHFPRLIGVVFTLDKHSRL